MKQHPITLLIRVDEDLTKIKNWIAKTPEVLRALVLDDIITSIPFANRKKGFYTCEDFTRVINEGHIRYGVDANPKRSLMLFTTLYHSIEMHIRDNYPENPDPLLDWYNQSKGKFGEKREFLIVYGFTGKTDSELIAFLWNAMQELRLSWIDLKKELELFTG